MHIFHFTGQYLSFDSIYQLDYISRTCISFLIFIEIITALKHLTFNYYVYLMRMTLNMAGRDMISCVVVITVVVTAYSSLQYLTVGPYSYAFRDMLSAAITSLRTGIAIVKMKIYFETTFAYTTLNKLMLISFFFCVTLILMNVFISIINNAMEIVKGDKISSRRLHFDYELNTFFWRKIDQIFRVSKTDDMRRQRGKRINRLKQRKKPMFFLIVT